MNRSSGGRKSTPIILRLLPREQPSRLHLLLVSIIMHRFLSFFFFFSLAHIDDDDLASHVFCPSLASSTASYKHADGKKIDGRRVLVDVERGRTVKGWRPRRLGQLQLLLNVDHPLATKCLVC